MSGNKYANARLHEEEHIFQLMNTRTRHEFITPCEAPAGFTTPDACYGSANEDTLFLDEKWEHGAFAIAFFREWLILRIPTILSQTSLRLTAVTWFIEQGFAPDFNLDLEKDF